MKLILLLLSVIFLNGAHGSPVSAMGRIFSGLQRDKYIRFGRLHQRTMIKVSGEGPMVESRWVFMLPMCPSGYTYTEQNLDGKGKQFSHPGSRIRLDCGKFCDGRPGCTGLEYKDSGSKTCITYTGGKANIMKNKSPRSWRSCLKD